MQAHASFTIMSIKCMYVVSPRRYAICPHVLSRQLLAVILRGCVDQNVWVAGQTRGSPLTYAVYLSSLKTNVIRLRVTPF